MKSFKYLVFILVIFFKTGNVLSESTLFNVNNVEISSNLSANNQFFINKAINKGFNEMMKKVLLEKDITKLKNLNSNKIKDLVSYYQIIETIEDRINNKLIKKYNIFFDKEKVHKLFFNYGISYSDVNQYEIYFLPIHKKNDQLYVYNQNYFYEKWNEVDDNEFIEFISPLEKIEVLTNINNYQDNLFDLDLENIFIEYSKKNFALIIIEENISEKYKIFLKTNIMGKNINKSLIIKDIEKKNSNFYDDIIIKAKKEIVNLVKSQNLIDIRTPSFINIKFFMDKKNNLVELDNRIKKIDLIENLYFLEINRKYVILKIKYLGKINKIIDQLKVQNILLEFKNDQWSLEII
tara:strand:+ start:27 stop:1076 length:1050 start_codon:yes stop_codon:yes gene_type:complete